MKFKYLRRQVFRILVILCGITLILYPWISNYLYEKSASSEIVTYDQEADKAGEDRVKEMLKQAYRYNEELAKSHVKLTDPFMEKEKNSELKRYSEILCISSNGVMAVVEIPCIGVKLPVYHGTTNEVLEKGIGHLEGSSLPIGGTGTHAVLTGHTGLSSAKLFTDLTELKKGDLFYIHVLGEILAYEVDDINVVLPEDTGKLTILPGEDHVTLLTCTPYGVNSHRLLVRGTRTEYIEEKRQEKRTDIKSKWFLEYRRALLAGLAIGAVFCIIRRRKR